MQFGVPCSRLHLRVHLQWLVLTIATLDVSLSL